MFSKSFTLAGTLFLVYSTSFGTATESSCTSESLPNFMELEKCFVIPEDLCTNPDMLMPFTESLISCGIEAIADLELPSKLFLMEGIVVNVLQSVGLGKISSALFGVCKTVGGILDTLDDLTLGIAGTIIDPLKKSLSFLPIPDCSANSIKGTVKCGSRVSVKLPSSLKATECFKHVKTTCNGIKSNKGPALVDLFDTISCLTGKAFDVTTPEGVAGLACSVLTGLAKNARIIDFHALLPIPLPGLGNGGSSTSASEDKDESKGLISNVLDIVTDPLSILKPHDQDSDDGDKPQGLISSVLDAVTNPLSALSPNTDDSSDDKPKGLVPTVLDAVTNPLSILDTSDDSDKPKGLISTVLDAVTPDHDDDDGKPKGLISSIVDSVVNPGSESDADSSDSTDASTSSSQDKEQPKGLISGMLDAIASPLLGHDSQTKDDTDSQSHEDEESTSEDKPHGLLSNVLGIVGR